MQYTAQDIRVGDQIEFWDCTWWTVTELHEMGVTLVRGKRKLGMHRDVVIQRLHAVIPMV